MNTVGEILSTELVNLSSREQTVSKVQRARACRDAICYSCNTFVYDTKGDIIKVKRGN